MTADPAFLIVGTPRSGTTLVQRIALELPGVLMPHETHFFSQYALDLLARQRFPLTGGMLREELSRWAHNPGLGETEIDVEPIYQRLDGRASNLWAMFSAIVATLAGGDGVLGEKTPQHLHWCIALARTRPRLRFVAVVRDPRGVIASQQQVTFGARWHILQAEGWRADQRLLMRARAVLGPNRLLIRRYEDIVADPETFRGEIARLLNLSTGKDVSSPASPSAPSEALFLPWETWKHRAAEPVTSSRRDVWQTTLTSHQIVDIERICGAEMHAFGYSPGASGASQLMPMRNYYRRARFRMRRWRRQRQIESIATTQALGHD